MHPWETRIYYAVLAGVLFIAVLVISFLILIIVPQAKKLKHQLLAVKEGLNTMEKERARIAADLHDDLGASLSAIKLQLQLLEVNNEQQAIIATSGKYIDEAVSKLKAVALSLMPRLLEKEGLCTAVNELVEMLINRTLVKVHFYCNINHADPALSLHIYRIVQEIITNVHKHARATEIEIDIRPVKQNIQVHIADNGIGFNKTLTMNSGAGLGLHNIRSRVDILNARLNLKTKPGSGTTYFIKIPYHDK